MNMAEKKPKNPIEQEMEQEQQLMNALNESYQSGAAKEREKH